MSQLFSSDSRICIFNFLIFIKMLTNDPLILIFKKLLVSYFIYISLARRTQIFLFVMLICLKKVKRKIFFSS